MQHQIIDYNSVAATWLTNFGERLTFKDTQGSADCFLPNGWLRDLLIFTWDRRSLHGQDKITNHLSQYLKAVEFSNFELEDDPHLKPELAHLSVVSSGFKFTTPHIVGRGYFSLVQVDPNAGLWKALFVNMSAEHIKGHEEMGEDHTAYQGTNGTWPNVQNMRKREIETNPSVLVIGGGQTGLNIAARFKQMEIQTLVIEKNARIGDNWRNRYPSLFLHTIRSHHGMLYQPFPKNWPLYTPRDKLADWIEHYAVSQDLVVWTKSTIIPFPTYDQVQKKWTVAINRDGEGIIVRPTHIVVAIGTIGAPYIPPIPGLDLFSGHFVHSADFKGGKAYTGKNVAVIGAGNSAADICVDLFADGAETITMIQKSSTCVIFGETVKKDLFRLWPENVPTEVSDFKVNCMPYGLLKTLTASQEGEAFHKEIQMHKELKEVGFSANLGPYGTGHFPLILGRLGGYWLDYGCAKLITEKKVLVKSGVEIDHITKDSLVFKDGSVLEADAIVACTGFKTIHDSLRSILPPEVVEKVGNIWGLDEETELQGAYKPLGIPGSLMVISVT
ncbi:FAD/NAD-P-binding domain-containing protein [Cyathus striatus]|nr:FAD/NAD-P-binding domain-containing protein [Cyathus striatus]